MIRVSAVRNLLLYAQNKFDNFEHHRAEVTRGSERVFNPLLYAHLHEHTLEDLDKLTHRYHIGTPSVSGKIALHGNPDCNRQHYPFGQTL